MRLRVRRAAAVAVAAAVDIQAFSGVIGTPCRKRESLVMRAIRIGYLLLKPLIPAVVSFGLLICSGCTHAPSPDRDAATLPTSSNPAAYTIGPVLYQHVLDDLSHWKVEAEQPGTIQAKDGTLSIDVPKGCTVWFRYELSGPVLIRYAAQMVQKTPPGANDRVSDMNCFWMATDPRAKSAAPDDFFTVLARTGAFATYNQLQTYYVGQGGNTNTTTRFRRYVSDAANRPLLPEHDRADHLLAANVWYQVQLAACGPLIEYSCNGQRIFQYHDGSPCTHGYFGFRTTWNHMEVRGFEVRRLVPNLP
jgi:hypothetical protein